jgi:DNA modification methylase
VAKDLTAEQAKAYRLMDNRSQEAEWDEDLLAAELAELAQVGAETLTGFDRREINQFLAHAGSTEGLEDPDKVTEPPAAPVSVAGDLWLCGDHRVLCGDATSHDAVERLLAGQKLPILMVTDPPYGIELDSEWRDRAGLNTRPGKPRSKAMRGVARKHPTAPAEPSYMKHRTAGHNETTISGDTRADWSEAFALVPSLQVAYVWHASVYTREVLEGLLKIGFLYPQQIIWDKGRVVLTRTHYWYQHEPCWYVRKPGAPWLGDSAEDAKKNPARVELKGTTILTRPSYSAQHEPCIYVRKKNAPWFGVAGENSTVWSCPSPKFIMGGSDEQKYDHPTQKPVMLAVRPIANHTMQGDAVYEPFLGSGTTLIAAEMTSRRCFGLELDPKFVDVVIRRWQEQTGKKATLEGVGHTFDQIAATRAKKAA